MADQDNEKGKSFFSKLRDRLEGMLVPHPGKKQEDVPTQEASSAASVPVVVTSATVPDSAKSDLTPAPKPVVDIPATAKEAPAAKKQAEKKGRPKGIKSDESPKVVEAAPPVVASAPEQPTPLATESPKPSTARQPIAKTGGAASLQFLPGTATFGQPPAKPAVLPASAGKKRPAKAPMSATKHALPISPRNVDALHAAPDLGETKRAMAPKPKQAKSKSAAQPKAAAASSKPQPALESVVASEPVSTATRVPVSALSPNLTALGSQRESRTTSPVPPPSSAPVNRRDDPMEPGASFAHISRYELELSRPHVEPPRPVDMNDLPEVYGDTRCTMLIRDPEWVYIYWEISDHDRRRHGLIRDRHDRATSLRIHDVTGVVWNGANAHGHFDIGINEHTTANYYLRIEPHKKYVAELGYYDELGRFTVVASTQPIVTPRHVPSVLRADDPDPGPEPPAPPVVQAPVQASLTAIDSAWPATAGDLFFNPAAEYLPDAPPVPSASDKIVPSEIERERRIYRMSGGGDTVHVLMGSEFVPIKVQAEDLEEWLARPELPPEALMALMHPGGFGLPSSDVHAPKPLAEIADQARTPEQQAASSEAFPMASSAALGKKPKDFWLRVHTELILYGATEPDARVTVMGQPVDLRPDGTFTLRFAFPEGTYDLPVRAVNADGDMEKSITPVAQRSTKDINL